MSKILYILPFLGALLGLSACSEASPDDFQDITGVYFNNRSSAGALLDSTSLTFVYVKDDEVEVPVKVQLLGRAVDYARPFSITVSSDDAVEGVDYELVSSAEMPAGEYYTNYMVKLKRTDALKKAKKTIYLELHANDYFSLPYTSEVQAGGDATSALRYRIVFSDMFTSAPTAWEDDILGTFTQQKFELVCDVLDLNPADFNDSSVMTLALQMYIYSEITAYIKDETAKKNSGQAYNEAAFDDNGEPLSFRPVGN